MSLEPFESPVFYHSSENLNDLDIEDRLLSVDHKQLITVFIRLKRNFFLIHCP